MPRNCILVVDDDQAFVSNLSSALTASGYTVLNAGTVEAAFSILDKETVGLIVVDLNLPDKSGLELIHSVNKRGNGTKILAITGVLSDLHLEIATYMGAHLAVHKFPRIGSQFPMAEWSGAVAQAFSMDARTRF
jgi:DNA-binding response OmpR family regulator